MKIKEALNDGTLSLEDEIDYADMTEEEYKQEIERLNNIINELEKEISKHIALCTDITLNDVLDILQELKHKKIYGSVDSEIIYFDEVGSDKE